jgi:hypothetical protein
VSSPNLAWTFILGRDTPSCPVKAGKYNKPLDDLFEKEKVD